jgi:hypothetical protein
LNWVKGEGSSGLGRRHIHWGGNSGFQAINLAYLWGASRIVLLGFDMQVDQISGASHWFGEHKPAPGVPVRNPKKFDSWIRHLETMARDLTDAGIQVYNATRTTALTCFPRIPIDQILG